MSQGCNYNNLNMFSQIEKRIQQENTTAISDSERLTRASFNHRAKRPTALVTPRMRSESPSCRQKRLIDCNLSPSPSSNDTHDMDLKAQKKLERKNGVLQFGNETLTSKMEDFRMHQCLGTGTCSDVYLAVHLKRPDLTMAVKQMRKSSNSTEENRRIMKDLSVVTQSNDCPHIVLCLGIFMTKEEVWICMEVMSTCLDKLLKQLKEPFPESVVSKMAVSIIVALDYLKTRHNIMHRDVKPSNMLLSETGVVKLCDFGISGKLKDSIARSRQLGCIGYMAPERLERGDYDVRADVWSLGISLIELATAEFPYKGVQGEFAVMSRILSDPSPSLAPGGGFSESFRGFIDYCLIKDFKHRPKYLQLKSTEFFRRHGKSPLHVCEWYQSVAVRGARPLQALSAPSPALGPPPAILSATATTTSCSCSSGYASTTSDSSPGSLGSQSRSPLTDTGPVDGVPSSGCFTGCFCSRATAIVAESRPLCTIPQGSLPQPRTSSASSGGSTSTLTPRGSPAHHAPSSRSQSTLHQQSSLVVNGHHLARPVRHTRPQQIMLESSSEMRFRASSQPPNQSPRTWVTFESDL